MRKDRELDQLEENMLLVAGTCDALDIEELAVKTGESKDKLLQKLQDEEFNQMFVEAVGRSFLPDLPQIAKAFSEKAKSGHFQHGKLIFEITGLYKEKKELDANIGMQNNVSPFQSDEEKESFIEATLATYRKKEADSDD